VDVANANAAEKIRVMLGLLACVERGDEQSQRRIASELGVALGLVNAYLKRCVKKGLVKVRQAPARRYVYYLTPRGLAEKSRLTATYLSYSFSLFRQARRDCLAAMEDARARGFTRLALLGASELAEIAAISALESGISIAVIVDPNCKRSRFAGIPVKRSMDRVTDPIDAVLITDLSMSEAMIESLSALFDRERIFVPALLGPQKSEPGIP
jgi:DNA-binding MarR family transcriptional regulator